jgi:drug/metabolite transporter (DMT)-like permease
MSMIGAVPRPRIPVLTPGLLPVALGAMLFGSSGVLILLSYDHGANAAGVLTIRALATLPWVLVLMRAVHRSAVRSHAGLLAVMAVLVTTGVAAFTLAIRDMSPALVALINYAYPVYVIIGARMLGWIRLDALTTVAAAAALGGVGLTIGIPGGEIGLAGVLLSILSGGAYAVYLLMAENAMRLIGPISAMSVVGGLTSVFLLVACLFSNPEFPSDPAGIAITGILFLCLCFPHALLLRGVGQIGGTWGALVSSLEVVTAVVTTALIVGVPLSPGLVLGGILILLGGLAAPIVASRRDAVRERRSAAEVHRPVAEKCW